MSSFDELTNKCMKLAYSNSVSLSDEIYKATATDLKILWPEYGYANVLGALAGLWSFDKATTFFTHTRKLVQGGGQSINVVATSFHKAYGGGVERVNAELMNLWIDMGLKVVFFTEEAENSLDFPYPSSVKRIIIPNTHDMTGRLLALQKYCLEEKVDLFINHNWTNCNFIWECMLMKMLRISYVQYCHGHFSWCFSQGKQSLFQAEAFNLCDVVVAISESNARFYQMCGCKSFLVHNPVPTDLKNARQSNLNSNHVLMVGRLAEEKYPLEALAIFKKVHERVPEAILDVVGDGPMDEEMYQYVHKNGLDTSVVFHGKKSQEEIAGFYQNCACGLFTSKMEGYPMVVLETKAYGVPIVMYDLPYLSLTKDKKGVLSAEISDFEAMADNVVNLLNNDNYRIDQGREARESFEELLRYDLHAAWNSIFDICITDDKHIQANGYYNPESLAAEDKYIMPLMIEKIKDGYDNMLKSSMDYKVGKSCLEIPRKVKSFLRILKRGS